VLAHDKIFAEHLDLMELRASLKEN